MSPPTSDPSDSGDAGRPASHSGAQPWARSSDTESWASPDQRQTDAGYAQPPAKPPATGGHSRRARRSRQTRVGLVAAAVVLIGVIAVVGIGRFGGGGDDLATDADDMTEDELVPIEVGEMVNDQVEPGGSWHGSLTVPEDSMVSFRIFGGGATEADTTLELLDEAGELVAANEERGATLADLIGGYATSPNLVLWLEAGEYTVVVSNDPGREFTGFRLLVERLGAIGAGEVVAQHDVGEAALLIMGLLVDEPGEHTITASTEDDSELVIAVFTTDGETYEVTEPPAVEASLTQELDVGLYTLIIQSLDQVPGPLTLSVERE